MVVSAVFEGKQILAVPSGSNYSEKTLYSGSYAPADDGITNKVRNFINSIFWSLLFIRATRLFGTNYTCKSEVASNHILVICPIL